MKYTLENKILSIDYSTLVETVKLSEFTRSFDSGIAAFSEIWQDLDTNPDFSEFSPTQQAELFRISGSFLSNYGKFNNLKNYQERGKNLLFNAIELYTSFGETELVADAQNALAICYFYEGAIVEAETILEQTALEFLEDQLSLVYLQNRGNLLLTKLFQRKYEECLAIIEEIEVPMEFCEDIKACFVFHEKAGLAYRGVGQYDKAVSHYHKAIYYGELGNNLAFVSSAKNNLAFLYNKINKFDLAHENINEAIRIAEENKQFGWLAGYYDTKALIFANQKYFDLALDNIEKALKIIKSGEDARVLTEALWNKCKFLLALDRKEEAITLFGELIPIAGQQMGEFAVKIFVKEFSDLIHIKQNGSLDEEVQRFKRVEIVNAIREAKYNLSEAAEILKITHSALVKTIDKEFPELYQELDLLPQTQNLSVQDSKPSAPRNISKLTLENVELIFENKNISNFVTFYFSAEKMSEAFGINQDGVVAIEPLTKITADEFVLVEDIEKNIYTFGKVNYDSLLDLYFFVSEDEPIPITFEDVRLIGKAVGFCPFEEIDNDKVVFRSLQTA